MAPRTAQPDGTYLLRGIDREKWARFKAKAEADDIPMSDLILLLAEAYTDGQITLGTRTLSNRRRRNGAR